MWGHGHMEMSTNEYFTSCKGNHMCRPPLSCGTTNMYVILIFFSIFFSSECSRSPELNNTNLSIHQRKKKHEKKKPQKERELKIAALQVWE